ncbi:MAG: Transcriptional regulator, GntR family [Mesotoga prima]|uniref:Transcriptional regulator, GntR family n=1 Tax=Mesotoga prima TaxID=1184387 RepID=A0A117M2J8_9BACT|nr:MAG: Transcriptional regulator, GntR family [Mesotoga prima]
MNLKESERIDFFLSEPLHSQLTTIIKNDILTNRWQPGEKIPNQQELCEMFNVSLAVVRQAVEKLVSEGFLCKRQGKGTFVVDPRIRQGPRKLTSLSQELSARGSKVGAKVLTTAIETPGARLARIFGLSEKERIIRIRRLRLMDNSPLGIQTFFCPERIFPEMLSHDLTQSLYDLVEYVYGIKIVAADETYTSIILGESECKCLKVDFPHAGFYVERVSRGVDGSAVEYTESFIRGDRYSVQIHLRR